MSTMTTKHASHARAKTPFDAIRDMEYAAATRISEEEQRLQKEYDDACQRAMTMREESEQQLTDRAREELRAAKSGITGIIETCEREAEKENAKLEQHAKGRKEPVLVMLKKNFLSLF